MYISDHIITSKHYLVHFVCAFAFGILLATRFGIVISLCLSLLVGAMLFLFCLILKICRLFKIKHLILSIVLIFASVLGIFRIYYAEYIQSDYLRQYDGKEAWLCGTISSDPHITSSGNYYSFELDVFGVSNQTSNFGTVIMYIPRDFGCNFHSGDNIYAWTKLKAPENQESSSDFDYITYLRGKNIFITGTTRNINPLPDSIRPYPITILKNAGNRVRSKIGYSIDTLFPADNVSSAILKGILIGDKSGFSDELYQQFSYSGISHIVAVSGLHISILFSFLMIFSKYFFLNRKINLLAIVPAIILFMSASAFTPSVCRASIMILIMICSSLFREEYNPVTSLFLALGLILTNSPYALFSKSLILSFAATLGIFVYFPYINHMFVRIINAPRLKLQKHKTLKKCLLYPLSSIALSLSSFIGTAYFIALFFGGVSKVQFLTNLWVIPLVSIIFCLGYVCCILYYVCPWLVTHILHIPLDWCLKIIKFTVDKLGIPDNMLNISDENLNATSAILYFGIALMIYMFLKALQDIYIEKSSRNL